VIAPRLSERLGTPVLIENRPGAAGIIAMDAAARAAADGYTLLFANLTLVTGPVLFEMNFDPLTELAPVVQLTEFYYVLLAANNFAPRTAAEVLALGRSQPGRVSCASGGGMSEFGCALLRALGRIDINQVRYKGNGPAMNDLAGGQVNLLFDIASVAGASVRSGRARALATTAAPAVVPAGNPAANLAASRPAGQFAALPLMAELLPGFEVTGWQGLVTRSGTHPDIVARLNREVRAVLQIDEVRQRLQEEGVSIVAGSSEQFGEMIRSHGAKVLRLIKAHQIRIE
jgi:tripartite-type tricarboxylate transporter receptor subunit TctC